MAELKTKKSSERSVRLLRLSHLFQDLLLVPVALFAAFQLRFGLQPMPADFFIKALSLCLPLMALAALSWCCTGLMASSSRQTPGRLALAAFLTGFTGALFVWAFHGLDKVPRSSLVILGPLLWLSWLARRSLLEPFLQWLHLREKTIIAIGQLAAAARFGQCYWRQALDLMLFISFCGLLYWAFLDRARTINTTFGEYLGCDDCLTSTLLLHDYLFLGALLLLFLMSFMARRFALYLPLRLLAIAGIGLYIGDIVLMNEFSTRLMLSDIRVYGQQLPIIWRHITGTAMFANQYWILPVVLGGLLLLVFLPPVGKASRKSLLAMALLPLVAFSSGAVFVPPSYVQDWALRNVLAANFNNGVTIPYSDAYRQQLLESATSRVASCRMGADQSPDIILLVLESWSPFQSRLWSGIENWTPRLDELATEHAWYSRMHAGGFTTNEGLMSLLTGLEFLAPTKSYFSIMPFETAWETPQSIPRQLADNKDYHSAFLTTGNLRFTSKGKWLRSLGFDYVEGHDYRGYRDRKRLHFDAAADEYLYDRSLDYFLDYTKARQRDGKPLFMTIENVSSHHPYIHPRTGERSARAVFRYMDGTAHRFYRELEETGFFDNGVLLIVGDHRAMIPITLQETQRFGQAAASLVPAIVVGAGLSGEIATPFHQSDFLGSLNALTAGDYCHQGPYRNLLEPEQSQFRCLYHARGDNRDHIDVFCPLQTGEEATALVELKGDATRILQGSGMTPELEQRVLLEINRHRIEGDERTLNLLESGYFN